ncbi:MAG: hypothetical protein HY273_08780 [Gammaproteobacteria bacterium]|nr:hypothetical protein [Gammaproteobacteria bacterium]
MSLYLLRILWVVLLAATPVRAQDFFDIPAETLPSSATLEGGGDATGSRSLTIHGDFGLAGGTRFHAGFAGVRADTGSANYTGDTYWAGVNSDPLAAISFGLNYEIMRREDAVPSKAVAGTNNDIPQPDERIQSSAAKANLLWRINRWRVSAYPELRSITLTKTLVTLRNKARSAETTIQSPGLGIAIAYNGLQPWSFGLRHFVYRYDTDLQTLSNHPIFSQKMTSYVESHVDQSFDSSRSGVNVDYAPSWGSIGLEATRSESAIGHAVAHSTAINLSWDVSPAWSIFAHAGHGRADGVDAAGFGSAGVTWIWGE